MNEIETGGNRDRCSRCGGWKSLGHAAGSACRMDVKHTFVCGCGHEMDCGLEDLDPGAVFECRCCNQVWGRVRPNNGGRAWVKISAEEVAFHDLLYRGSRP
jgi:hypothetical protein